MCILLRPTGRQSGPAAALARTWRLDHRNIGTRHQRRLSRHRDWVVVVDEVDSVIVVQEGRVEILAELNRGGSGLEQQVMDGLIMARDCRWLVLSRNLDGG